MAGLNLATTVRFVLRATIPTRSGLLATTGIPLHRTQLIRREPVGMALSLPAPSRLEARGADACDGSMMSVSLSCLKSASPAPACLRNAFQRPLCLPLPWSATVCSPLIGGARSIDTKNGASCPRPRVCLWTLRATCALGLPPGVLGDLANPRIVRRHGVHVPSPPVDIAVCDGGSRWKVVRPVRTGLPGTDTRDFLRRTNLQVSKIWRVFAGCLFCHGPRFVPWGTARPRGPSPRNCGTRRGSTMHLHDSSVSRSLPFLLPLHVLCPCLCSCHIIFIYFSFGTSNGVRFFPLAVRTPGLRLTCSTSSWWPHRPSDTDRSKLRAGCRSNSAGHVNHDDPCSHRRSKLGEQCGRPVGAPVSVPIPVDVLSRSLRFYDPTGLWDDDVRPYPALLVDPGEP